MSAIGILILHGFAGDVKEVLPLAHKLRDLGYMIECPTLEGHGLGRSELAKSKRHDWLFSAEEAYKRLSMRADQIVVIGFSMGGLLAIHLAATYPVPLLCTVNTPYYYWDVQQALGHMRRDFRTTVSRYMRGMRRIPMRSMLQFRLLLEETKEKLPAITSPYLILQGMQDDTVQSVSAWYLAEQSGSPEPSVNYFAESGHQIFWDKEAEAAIDLIVRSLQERALLP